MKNLAYLTFILLLSACGKKYTATGRVYNPVNGKGIAGLEVQIRKSKACLGYDGCGSKLLETTTTDANGFYAIGYRQRASGQYLLFKNDLNEYDRLNSNIPGLSGNQVYDLLLVSQGYMQLSITNVNCFDNNDQLIITRQFHRSIPEFNNNNISTYDGCFDQSYGNTYTAMGWWIKEGTVTKNNITIPFADSVYVPEGGSVQWNIEY